MNRIRQLGARIHMRTIIGLWLILFGLLVILVPQILVAIVASVLIVAGLICLWPEKNQSAIHRPYRVIRHVWVRNFSDPSW